LALLSMCYYNILYIDETLTISGVNVQPSTRKGLIKLTIT